MGVRITDAKNVALYDSVSGTAFGPIFDSEASADEFIDWAAPHGDLRDMKEPDLMRLYEEWQRVTRR